nr:hypothetical protein [Tanacetum cinerariifolium]
MINEKMLQKSYNPISGDWLNSGTINIQKRQFLFYNLDLQETFLNEKQAAIRIQSHYHGWLSRSCFLKQKQAVMKLQGLYRSMKCLRNFRRNNLEFNSAMVIQSHTRGWIARRVACRRRCQIVLIQSVFRGWLMRREFLRKKEPTTKIQSLIFTCLKTFNSHKDAAIVIQRYTRGYITRKRLLVTPWIPIKATAQRRHHRIAVIQSYWKRYIERKHSREKVQQAAANVDDGKRIINRLIAALAELKNMKSVGGILHTCATLASKSDPKPPPGYWTAEEFVSINGTALLSLSPCVLVQNNKPNLSFAFDNKIVVVFFLKMRSKSVNDVVFKREAHHLTFFDIQMSVKPDDVERASSVVKVRVLSRTGTA